MLCIVCAAITCGNVVSSAISSSTYQGLSVMDHPPTPSVASVLYRMSTLVKPEVIQLVRDSIMGGNTELNHLLPALLGGHVSFHH